MANTPASKKAKGSRLEKKVAELYRRYEVDKTAQRMPMSGAIANLKGDIHKKNDWLWVDECKNTERVKLWEFWEQAEEQAMGQQIPVLHISGNHRPILTTMRIETYMDMRKQIKDMEDYIKELEDGRE